MKTSTRISLRFTLFVSILMVSFIILLNIAFFVSWHNNRGGGMMRGPGRIVNEQLSTGTVVETTITQVVPISTTQNTATTNPSDISQKVIHGNGMGIGVERGSGQHLNQLANTPTTTQTTQTTVQKVIRRYPALNVQRDFTINQDEFTGTDDLPKLWYAKDIYNMDGNWFMVKQTPAGYVLTDVTENVRRQNELLIVSCVLWLLFIGITYVLSRLFVSRSLRDLSTLADSVRSTDIETLGKKHTLAHLPDYDEINVVAGSIDAMQQTIADQVNSMKDFVSHVSHEFKTPLMILQSTTDVAEKTGDVTAIIPQYRKTVGEMKGILDTLTLLARSQSEIATQTENVDMVAMIDDIVASMRDKYAQKNIQVVIHANGKVLIRIHKSSASIVLTNVIENAFKYTPQGRNIDISVYIHGISVQDSGIGISQEAQKHIREPFWQVDKNREDGVGLGLHIVKRLVEILGWKINLESKEGNGTRVEIKWGN